MIYARVRETLRIHERGIKKVPPCWNANRCRVVRPFGLAALEKELGEDLGDLIIRRVQIARAQRIGGFDGGDEGSIFAEIGMEVGSGVVLSDSKDAKVTSALFQKDEWQDLPSLLRIRSTHDGNRCDIAGQSHPGWVRYERYIVHHGIKVKNVNIDDLLDRLCIRGTHAR